MARRTLKGAPNLLPLYARAAAPMIPGAALLPFIPGAGGEVPEIELELPAVTADPEKVAAYAKVCGFNVGAYLPVTYPHVLAFPLHMAVMADGRFPFGAVGLVHVENRIVQRRPISAGEETEIRVWPTQLEPHSRGRTFTLRTEVSVAGEIVWEGYSTMLRRGGGDAKGDPGADGERQPADAGAEPASDSDTQAGSASAAHSPLTSAAETPQPSATWRLPGDLGRRYAAVSGDRNPIHMHSLSAKAFGFPQAIAHGMWSKARCLAALQGRLPDAFETQVRFRKPILLPAHVQFASTLGDGLGADSASISEDLSPAGGPAASGVRPEIHFSLTDAKRGTPHLDGRVSTEIDERAANARTASERNHT